MSEHVIISAANRIGFITLNRAQALNALSLEMIRIIAGALRQWHNDPEIRAVVIRSASEKAFSAGGDIRFFYKVANAAPGTASALLEDFFTEEYALNHLIHYYPKPYLALMDGIVVGGGMGISQAGPDCRMRIVTERTRMAMPEVHIGLFPDVGGSYFLSRAPGQIGTYLGLTGEAIGAADALYAGLADEYLPSAHLQALLALLQSTTDTDLRETVRSFTIPFRKDLRQTEGFLTTHRSAIDHHFSHDSVPKIISSLNRDDSEFARKTLQGMLLRSPLMLAVTLEQLRRGAEMSLADCLRMERTMVRHCFEHFDVMEGIRARIIDKDNHPRWSPASLEQVTPAMVERFFSPVWPEYAHPLKDLQ